MDGDKLQKLNLHHLNILAVLLEEQHVSRAANRLSVTQSAVSKVLANMRLLFNDPLLVRASGGYELTLRARSVQAKLITIMSDLAELPLDGAQDPSEVSREIRIGIADDTGIVYLPKIIKCLKEKAPNLRLTINGDVQNFTKNMHSNNVDMAIEISTMEHSGLIAQPISVWTRRCVMPISHFCAEELTPETFLRANHGLVSHSGKRFGPVDQALGLLGQSRKVTIMVPWFSAVPAAIEYADVIFTVPAPMESLITMPGRIVSRPPPVEIPDLSICLFWHPRHQYDRVHSWIRKQIAEAMSDMGARDSGQARFAT